ncbi:MAG: wax ester/triacylglycerol synthase family O-acyltransferase [Acidimicrobiia bacterium]|nr:wax ester/triacylglycerol synthase family O-acyltransferase [Acidimicrobiia bacterium]
MAERQLTFDAHMSDQEALMWALEQDPVLRSTFGQLSIFDRPADPARFRERLARAARIVPRLHQRVVEPVSGLGPPEWVDDPLFDLDYHVRRVAVPPPGTERQLLDLAALLSSDPFDRARPLWQFTLIEGLEDGRGALLGKLHHTVTDGEGGVRLSSMFVDLERDATEPLGGEPEPLDAGDNPDVDELADILGRGPVASMADGVLGGVRSGLDLARRALTDTVATMSNPSSVPDRAATVVDGTRSVLRQLSTTEPARSPLWSERSLRRHLEVMSVPLDDAKLAAKALGGTVNDLFVTGAVGAAGAYHRASGQPVDELRMAMPISTRSRDEEGKKAGGNAFAPTRMLVPTGIEDPAERFTAVQATIGATRKEPAFGLTDRVAGVLGALPDALLVRVARQQVGTVDFTTSNVRGAPFDLYIAGAHVLANYPLGPMAGTAFNLTTLSYRGQLDMGCLMDPAAVQDTTLMRTCLVESYEELLDRS